VAKIELESMEYLYGSGFTVIAKHVKRVKTNKHNRKVNSKAASDSITTAPPVGKYWHNEREH
jgi:hypothetical protein